MSQSRSTTIRTRLSLSSQAGTRVSLFAVLAAVALHLAIIVATLFTWEHRLEIAQEAAPVVPVDLVTVADKTNIRAQAPTPVPIPQPQVQPVNLQPPPPLPQEESEPAPEQAPSSPAIKPPPPPAIPKAKPQPPAKKVSEDKKLADIINQFAESPKRGPSAKRHGPGDEMTADLKTIFYSELHPCWDVSAVAGAPNPEQLVVQIELSLNPDGTVAGKPQLTAQSAAAASANRYVQATADAAIRAIQRCQPFKLPANRYAEWNRSLMTFTPTLDADEQ